jgi:hypothetical protein
MVYHLVISNRKQITFAFGIIYICPVPPHFLKRRLNNIPGILFMTKVLKDEPVHVVRILSYALIILFLGHKQNLSVILFV